MCARSDPDQHRSGTALRDNSPEEARCAPLHPDGEEAHSQAGAQPRPPRHHHPLEPGHPAPYRDGDADRVGPGGDEGESACVQAHERAVLGAAVAPAVAAAAAAWMVEGALVDGNAWATDVGPMIRVLCPW